MSSSSRGLYESLVTEALARQLVELDSRFESRSDSLRPAEAADRIALHLGRAVLAALESVDETERVSVGLELVRRLLAPLADVTPQLDLGRHSIAPGARVLRAILAIRPDGTAEELVAPLIPLLDTTLLTNSPGEPRVGSQIETEVHSADRVDVVMAFVRRSGIGPLARTLQEHCGSGRPLRVLTTTYTGSTEASALELLRGMGANVRVSYDTSTTRLHAKAWLFHRASGFSTAYVGSSNLTHSAQLTGLEWNVRVSGARNPDVVDKMSAVFDAYWHGGEFVPYDRAEFLERTRSADPGPRIHLSPLEIRLEPFQERLLELIELARAQGRHRNLLASATGTGKTVMAAVDYARLRASIPRDRLLFVAHRREILDASLATFRHVLRDSSFGELWVGEERPSRFEHVFASIQSLHARTVEHVAPDHFDVVIVDEFHHAAAPSYRALLERVEPRELLGLTATPERSDGVSILPWFGDRIAAELRLWDAIDQHHLVPFLYYGIHDGVDLREVPWKRGRGYDVAALESVYLADDRWVRLVVDQVAAHVDDPLSMRALGFCVGVAHARFMARHFEAAGIAARAVWSDSPEDERRSALADLAAGRVQIVFSVDLFNEGVDVPTVDTLLFLRPTDSPVLFVQQLGRGLRKCTSRMGGRSKDACTVLDFVGQHRREFRFDRRFSALLGGTRKELQAQIECGFPFLPAGCHMELDPVARRVVLENLRSAVPSLWRAKVEELGRLAIVHADLALGDFLRESGLDLTDVYDGRHAWSDLRSDAALAPPARDRAEEELRRACGRLLHVDDPVRLDAYRRVLASPTPPAVDALTEHDRRLIRMLVASVAAGPLSTTASLAEGCELVWRHGEVRREISELCDVLSGRVDHVQARLSSHPDVPLLVHARYSRIEILAALGVGDTARTRPWREGVLWAAGENADAFAFTLDKTSGGFSPTTRYRDYAISRELIHWESQSTTSADSPTGSRYRTHRERGSSVLLFARLRADERAFWFLGPATYVRHESELPMKVVWRLHHALPGDLYASFAAAVA